MLLKMCLFQYTSGHQIQNGARLGEKPSMSYTHIQYLPSDMDKHEVRLVDLILR